MRAIITLAFLPVPALCLVSTRTSLNEQTVGRPLSSTLPLRIDGVWYDLKDYADKHKGGRWLLEYARGRDVTPIFHAIHLHGHKKATDTLRSIPILEVDQVKLPSINGLGKSQLKAEDASQGAYVVAFDESVNRRVPFIDSDLRRDLQSMIRRRFPTIESMKATPIHWVRTGVFAIVCAGCWIGWLQGNMLATLLLPFAQWLLAAHTVHEATHGALSSNPTINYWAQFTAHPILFNVYVWIPQHLLSHHQYTNDPQHDVDVHHFASARLAKEQTPYSESNSFNHGWTFVWKSCLTTLGTCILQPLRTLLENPTPNFNVNITPVPSVVSKRKLLVSMLPSFFVILYPFVSGATGTMTPIQALFCEIWPWIGMSLIWTTMTQTSHIQASTQWNQEEDGCWTSQQIATSQDYSVGNEVVTWATAGLNNQGMHHAMPTISSAHFSGMYSEYEAICHKHDIQPRQTNDLGSACSGMLNYIFDLNQPPT